jgi:titin
LARPSTDVQLELSWQDNSPNETGFEIHRSTTGANGAFVLVKTVNANVTTASDPGRTPLTEYCYKVRNVRAHGKTTYSDFSNVACATTYGKPAPPASITTTRQWWGVITVAWSAAPTATGYRLQRSPTGNDPWTVVSRSDPASTSFDDPVRTGEEQACYRVIAYNTWGESAPSSATCSILLAAPTALAATPVTGGGGVDVNWTNSSLIADGYEVQRSGADFVFTAIGSVGPSVQQFHDAVTAQGRYWYRVRARKGAEFSAFSNSDDALVASAPPSAPTNTWTLPSSSSSISVNWEYAGSDVDTFFVERSTDGQASWTLAGKTLWYPYGSQYGFGDGSLTAEREVCYHVIAHNSGGYSAPSDPHCSTPMAAPTGLTATAIGSTGIRLTWTPNSTAHDGYEVRRLYCYEGGYYGGGWYCDYYTIASVDRFATSYDDLGFGPSESYTYVVVAFKEGPTYRGYSDWSNEASATTDPSP